MDTDGSGAYALLNQLADEFAARYRKGDRPSLQEYLDKYPHLADEIRELFPAMMEIEQVKEDHVQSEKSIAASATPQHIGDFHILREIGRGGMGIVYEAEQVSLGRHVALKVLTRSLLREEQQRRRFEREAKAAARLHHTNIVPVFGIGEHDSTPYYVMQFIHGLGLDDVLEELQRQRSGIASESANSGKELIVSPREATAKSIARSLLSGELPASQAVTAADAPAEQDHGPALERITPLGRLSDSFVLFSSSATLPGQGDDGRQGRAKKATYWQSVAKIGVQVADALAYAHKQGIQHRDIKPSNLLLDAHGTVWVADFGLAKTENEVPLTLTGDIVGTLRYMPPEALEGHSDPRGDIYALGLTLYELLALRPAFQDRNRKQLIRQVMSNEPVRLSKLNRQVPRDLEAIVHKAIDRDVRCRYQTADEVAADLQRFLDDEPIRARRIGLLEQLWRWYRHHRMVAALLASVIVLLMVLAGGAIVASILLGKQRNAAERAERDAQKKAYEALVSQAKAGRFSRRQGQRFETLRAIREALTLLPTLEMTPEQKGRQRDALRNLAISALILPDLHLLCRTPRPIGQYGAQVDRKHRYLLGDERGNVFLRSAGDGEQIAHLPGDGLPWRATFSPVAEERVWVYRRNGDGYRILEWEPASGATRTLVEKTCGQNIMSVSLDRSRWAIANDRKGVLEVRDIPSFRLVRLLSVGAGELNYALSPDGRQVALMNSGYGRAERHWVRVYDIDSGQVIARLQLHDQALLVEWMPDGRTLAISCWNTSEILLWDVPTRKTVRVLNRLKGGSPHFSINNTGDVLAGTSKWGGGLKLWQPRTGQVLLRIPEAQPEMIFARPWTGTSLYSPSSYWEKSREIWEIDPGLEYRTLARAESKERVNVTAFDISPDGRIGAVDREGTVEIWDMLRGEVLASLPRGGSGVWFQPGSGDLFTKARSGLLHWPISRTSTQELRIGPPIHCYSGNGTGYNIIHGSLDGRTIAVADWPSWYGTVFHTERPRESVRIGPYDDMRNMAVSPDGQFVAAMNEKLGAKIFDANTGKCLRDLSTAGAITRAAFSPDGRWLAIISVSGVDLWDARTWQVYPRIAGPCVPGWQGVSFSPDSRVLAFESGRGAIRLVDPATGRDLARLEDPNQDRATFMLFNADGSRLFVLSNDSQTIHIWDLRAIRRQLAAMGLDWNAPPLPDASEPPKDALPLPLRLHVDLGPLWDDVVLGAKPSDQHLRFLIAVNSSSLKLNPFCFYAYRQRGRCSGMLNALHFDARPARSAIADYSAALALLPEGDPNCIDLLSRRAGNYLSLQEHDRALDDIHRAEELDPACGVWIRKSHAVSLLQHAAHYEQKKDHASALFAFRTAVEIDPDHAGAHNALAWRLLTGPSELRDSRAALRHAKRAVALEPDQPLFCNTLGIALYRNGRFAEAIAPLKKSLQSRQGAPEASDLFFLSMCHHRLGDAEKAEECRKRAERWLRENKNNLLGMWVEPLKAFQAEAEAALNEPAVQPEK